MFPAPQSAERPTLEGTADPGDPLGCAKGVWSRADSFRYRWLRDGAVIKGASSKRYVVKASDRQRSIACRVTVQGPGGTKSKTSRPTKVGR